MQSVDAGLVRQYLHGSPGLCFLRQGKEPTGGALAYALQQLINGITLGMIYGLIAVGYTMVYGIIGMINFAHGDIFMVGAFVGLIVLTALSGVTSVPLGLLAALLISAALCGLYGFSIERVAYR